MTHHTTLPDQPSWPSAASSAAALADPAFLAPTLSGLSTISAVSSGKGGSNQIVGGKGDDHLVGGKGDDQLKGGQGNDSLDGSDGIDTAIYSGPYADYDITVDAKSGQYTVRDLKAGRDGTDTLKNIEYVEFSDGKRFLSTVIHGLGFTAYGTEDADALKGGAYDDTLYGLGGDDRLTGGGGSDALVGGAGIDWALYSGPASQYTVRPGTSSQAWTIADNVLDRDGSDRLQGVERALFSDHGVAFDITGTGHAAQVAKVIGAVFGKAALSNANYVGIGLSLIDGGMDYVDLASLAMGATSVTRPLEIVNVLWTNIVGSAPSLDQAQPYVDLLASGTTVGQLVAMAADTQNNIDHINLSGLAATGIDFIWPAA